MLRRRGAIGVGVVLATLGIALWLWPRAPARSVRNAPEARTERARAPSPAPTARVPWLYEPGLPGARIAGVVVDPTGRAVPAARVELFERELEELPGNRVVLVADANGRFDFGERPATAYSVLASHPDHGPGGTTTNLADPTAKPPAHELQVRLSECTRFTGDVVGVDARPLADVVIGSYGARMWGYVEVGRSSADGSFDVCAGSPVVFLRSGYGTKVLHLAWVHDRLRVILSPAARVLGTVVTNGGVPVAGAMIRNGGVAAYYEAQAITNADGRFELSDLPGQNITLQAEHADHGRSAGTVVTTAPGQTTEVTIELSSTCRRVSGRTVSKGKPVGGVSLLKTVSQLDGSFVARCVNTKGAKLRVRDWLLEGSDGSLADGEVDLDDLLVEVTRGAVIHGRVTAQGKPVEGAEIWEQGEAYGGVAESDASGAFTISGLAPGSYEYRAADRPRHRRSPRVAVEITKSSETTIALELESVGWIAGVFVGSDGEPLADARVEAAEPGAPPGERWFTGGRPPQERFAPVPALTDGTGAFEIGGLGPERYEVRANGYKSSEPWPIVDLAAGETRQGLRIVIDVPGKALIAGHVLRPSGAPVPGAVVRAGPILEVMSGPDGAFSLPVTGFGDPVWVDVVTSDGNHRRIDLPRGTKDARLIVPVPGGLDASIQGDGDDWGVAVSPVDKDVITRFRSDVRGRAFTVRFLDPGTYSVEVTGPGGIGSAEVNVEEGKVTPVLVAIGGTGRVRGHVRSFPSGTSESGLECSTGRDGPRSQSDREGRFELVDVKPGDVRILCSQGTIWFKGGSMGVVKTHVAPSQTMDVEVWTITISPEMKPSDIGMTLDPKPDGLRVAALVPGGLAATAGILVGDEVLTIDGGPARTNADVAAKYLLMRPPGTSVALGLKRADREFVVSLVIGETTGEPPGH